MADELITISRDGKEIGKYLESDLMMLIEQKKVLATDHYWKEGMTSWGLISQFIAMRKEAARQVKAAADAEAARLKKEAADQEKAKKAAQDAVVEAEAKRRVEALTFTCNCCQSRFIKPFNPESEAGDGAVEIFLGSLLIFIPIIGWLFMPFVILRGFAKIIASRIKTPHCPSCRSSNFSRREGSDKSVFSN